MNIISQIGKQISELFASLTPSARVMAVLMVGVIVISFGWILSAQQGSSKVAILGVLSPDQIYLAETALGAASLSGYDIEHSRIKVPSADKGLYLKALTDGNAIPPQWGDSTRKSLEAGLFDPPSLIVSRQHAAKVQNFKIMLEKMPRIDFATVDYDEAKQGFGRNTQKVCSITVTNNHNQAIGQSVLRNISRLATKTFAGLKGEDVFVMDAGSNTFYQASDDPHSIEENPLLKAQAEWEDRYEEKIGQLLTDYGDVRISVNVVLDPILQKESELINYQPTGVAVESESSRKDTESQKAGNGGRPGASPNALNQPQSIAATGPEQTSKVKESNERISSQFGHEATLTKQAPLALTSLKVGIGVPDSHYRAIWDYRQSLLPDDQKFDATDPADSIARSDELKVIETEILAEVENTVRTFTVGVREGEDRKDFYEVFTYAQLPPEEIPEATLAEDTFAWFGESWSTLAMLGIVLVSLGMMFSWVRSQKEDPEAQRKFTEGFGLELPENIGDELDLSTNSVGGEIDDETGERKPPTFDVTGTEMKDDLSALIKENPDVAVNLLKTWIGEAA